MEQNLESGVSADLNALSRLISLQDNQVLAARWETFNIGGGGGLGPGDWGVRAVLTLEPSSLERLLAQAAPASPQFLNLGSDAPPWLIEELDGHLESDAGSGLVVKTAPLDPEPFVRAPLLNGVMGRLGDSNRLFLYLFTS